MTTKSEILSKYTDARFYNMIEINPGLSDLCYFTHRLCSNARIITIDEYCDDLCLIKISSYSRASPYMYTPSSNSFGKKDEINIEKVLKNSKTGKAIVIHSALDINFVIKICNIYNPDLIITQDHKVMEVIKSHFSSHLHTAEDIDFLPNRFSQLKMHFWGNDIGFTALSRECDHIDGIYRRNSKVSAVDFDFSSLIPRIGYYNTEFSGIYEWAWSGPTNSAIFCVPAIGNVDYKITLFFFGTKIKLFSENIKLLVDEKILKSQYFPDDQKIEIWYKNIGYRIFIPIEIRYQRENINNHESRQIGFAIHKLRVEEII